MRHLKLGQCVALGSNYALPRQLRKDPIPKPSEFALLKAALSTYESLHPMLSDQRCYLMQCAT